jgi:hypothetical protein
MVKPTHPVKPRICASATVLVLLVCAVLLLSGCLAVPAGQTPGVVTVLVEVTRLVPETAAPSGTAVATSLPAAPRATDTPIAELSGATASSLETPEPPTPDTAEVTEPRYLMPYWPCDPTDDPQVYAVDIPETAAMGLLPMCITGFPPNSEVDLTVTYPDGRSEHSTELTYEDGTATVYWSTGASLPAGTYTFEATQGDLAATGSFEFEASNGSLEPTPEPETGQPSIEVYPTGGSGWAFEVTLSGFEPSQEVEIRLYVAKDDSRTDFEEIDSLAEQVDNLGEATFPLEITPGDYPTSWFALAYFLEDGSPIYAEFQVE